MAKTPLRFPCRLLNIDWDDLFRQANVAPRPCKLGKPLVAGGEWCLMFDNSEPGKPDLEFIVIQPPPLQGEETTRGIFHGRWAFFK